MDAGSAAGPRNRAWHPAAAWLMGLALLYLLLVGVTIIGDGAKAVSGGAEGAARIFAFASNPVIGVILGILATTVVQSSSTVTSVIVGLVAGGLPVSIAVPMVMGANMGTTVTNTIVSLGNLRDDRSFNQSFQAATVHDFFNLYSIFIFLPIELIFSPLERTAGAISTWMVGAEGASLEGLDFVGAATDPIAGAVVGSLERTLGHVGAGASIAIGIACIIAAVMYLGKVLRASMTGKAQQLLNASLGRGQLTGIASGTAVTVLVQSSSTSTSLIVPLAGAGVLTTRQVFPYTMGANIGTTLTSLLAATAVTGAGQAVALQIALVHFLYNLLGVATFAYVPWLRETPIWSARWLGTRAGRSRRWAFGYLLGVFFALPGLLLGVQASLDREAAIALPQPTVISSPDGEAESAPTEEVEESGFAID